MKSVNELFKVTSYLLQTSHQLGAVLSQHFHGRCLRAHLAPDRHRVSGVSVEALPTKQVPTSQLQHILGSELVARQTTELHSDRLVLPLHCLSVICKTLQYAGLLVCRWALVLLADVELLLPESGVDLPPQVEFLAHLLSIDLRLNFEFDHLLSSLTQLLLQGHYLLLVQECH